MEDFQPLLLTPCTNTNLAFVPTDELNLPVAPDHMVNEPPMVPTTPPADRHGNGGKCLPMEACVSRSCRMSNSQLFVVNHSEDTQDTKICSQEEGLEYPPNSRNSPFHSQAPPCGRGELTGLSRIPKPRGGAVYATKLSTTRQSATGNITLCSRK